MGKLDGVSNADGLAVQSMQVCRPDQFICLPNTHFDNSATSPTSRLASEAGGCLIAPSRITLRGIDSCSAEDSEPFLSVKDPASSRHSLQEMDEAGPTFDSGTFYIGNVNQHPLKSPLRATSGNGAKDYGNSGFSKAASVISPNTRTIRSQHPTLPASSAPQLSPSTGPGFQTILKSRIFRSSTMEQ